MEEGVNNGQIPADNTHPVPTGNASNPSPQADEPTPAPAGNQLLPKEAEKYLREAGNIEDEPDAQDGAEMDEEIKRRNGKTDEF